MHNKVYKNLRVQYNNTCNNNKMDGGDIFGKESKNRGRPGDLAQVLEEGESMASPCGESKS